MNTMITGDTGTSPASPYYKPEKMKCKCEHCQEGCNEVTTFTYCLATDKEEWPVREMKVCLDCFFDLSRSKNPNIIPV